MAGVFTPAPRIFVSHSHYDVGFCRLFVSRMRTSLGVTDTDTVFYDSDSLRAGDDFLARIQEEIVTRPVFIVVLTPQSVVANYVKHETNLALRLTIEHPGRRILPILAAECDPNLLAPSLLSYQMIDFIHSEFDRSLSRLVDVLRSFRSATDTTDASFSFQRSPQLAQALQLAAQTHDAVAVGDWDQAILQGEFAGSLSENQSNAQLWADLTLAYARQEKWQLANDAARRALDLDPFRGDIWSALAKSLTAQSDFRSALVAIDRARAITLPAEGDLRQALLKQRRALLVRLQEWDEVLDNIRQELAVNPGDPVARATRSQILSRLRRLDSTSSEANAYSRSLRRLPELAGSVQWPTLQAIESGDVLMASEPDPQGTAFSMQRRIGQAIKRFTASLRDS